MKLLPPTEQNNKIVKLFAKINKEKMNKRQEDREEKSVKVMQMHRGKMKIETQTNLDTLKRTDSCDQRLLKSDLSRGSLLDHNRLAKKTMVVGYLERITKEQQANESKSLSPSPRKPTLQSPPSHSSLRQLSIERSVEDLLESKNIHENLVSLLNH